MNLGEKKILGIDEIWNISSVIKVKYLITVI